MRRVGRARYLLVLGDTFSGWVEAFLTTNKKAHTVAQILLTEIIPGFGLPSSLQSDNGPEFTSKVTQQLVQFTLEISHSISSPVLRKGRKDE